MLISIYNEKLGKWEIKEYDSLTEDERQYYELRKRSVGKVPDLEHVRNTTENVFPNNVPRGTESRVACMPFTEAFFEAVKTDPVYKSVLMLIRQGSSLPEVIEVLLKDRQTLTERVSKLTVQLGEAEMKLLKLQYGNKAASK